MRALLLFSGGAVLLALMLACVAVAALIWLIMYGLHKGFDALFGADMEWSED